MGMNNSGVPPRMVIDIETYSLAEAAQFIEEPSAPANYKDPEKIAAYVAEKRIENLSRCALDVDLCRIVALGTQNTETGAIVVTTAHDDATERDMLEGFWHDTAGCNYIGFNILGFDLPVLMRRSLYLGLNYFRQTPVDRYKTPHSDLMEILSFNGKLKYRGLDFYCRRFGIAIADETSGADIDALVKADDWVGVEAHCRADVVKTALLARRIGVLTSEPVGVL